MIGTNTAPPGGWVFLIWAFPYTHRSSGIRALYRLCHHLNCRGFPTAVVADPGERLPDWNCFLHSGDVADSIVIYPEVVVGNPLHAQRVIRWVLNTPGLLGGEPAYADSELVFFYDRQRLAEVNLAVSEDIGLERELWTGLVDPQHIHPNATVARDIDCSFTYKGAELARTIDLPTLGPVHPLEELTEDLGSLGETLRRTRTLFSYDHYSNVLREAVISGCQVRVPDASGHWHDPRHCACERNIRWHPELETAYVDHFHSSDFVTGFVAQVGTRWAVPGPDRSWLRSLPFAAAPGWSPPRTGRWRRLLARRGGQS